MDVKHKMYIKRGGEVFVTCDSQEAAQRNLVNTLSTYLKSPLTQLSVTDGKHEYLIKATVSVELVQIPETQVWRA